MLDNHQSDALEHLNRLVGKVAFEKAEQLFPGEMDTTLGAIYLVKMSANFGANEIIKELNKKAEIDYAHIPSDRGFGF